MSLLSLSDVSVSFGANDILEGISCEANPGDCIGLVGRNGAGKTTLLRVLAGSEKPGRGQRSAARWLRWALVEQIPPLIHGARTVRAEVLSPLEDVLGLTDALHDAADAMAEGDSDAAETYAALLHRMETEGAYTYETRFAQVMNGLGFAEPDSERPLSVLSGGQRSRVGLARALMAAPDLLLMDEPTNHLDLYGLRWLESFLAKWPGAVVVTSHDRHFLDKVATRIWHVENRRLTAYPGNYTKFEELRAAELVRAQSEYASQQEYIAKEEAFINRYRAGQRAAEAQGRLKRLNRLERLDAPRGQRSVRFNLRSSRSGEVAVKAANLVVGYEGKPVLQAGDLELERGARVALIGRNGSGKTTLLRTIAGDLQPVQGSLRLGAGVTLAHYWQEAEGLNPSLTVLEELLREDSTRIQDARDLAGRFLFSGDDVSKRVADLSGGERSRLALAKLVRSGANLMLLDEPTNHLDIPGREALEQALLAFEGTLVFASHDRRLISRLATRLWLVEDGRLSQFNGGLDEHDARDTAPQPPPPDRQAILRKQPALTGQRRHQEALAAVEAAIEEHEQSLASLGEAINRASADGELALLSELGKRFETLQAERDDLLREWSEMA